MKDTEYMRLKEIILQTFKGGSGSGFFGHAGRPGMIGGSAGENYAPNKTGFEGGVQGGLRTYELPKLSQNDRERILDRLERGEITVDQANVDMVLAERVRIISGKVPQSVRQSLNQAVRDKVLGHMPKDKLMPEVYYHPAFRDMAVEARWQIARSSIDRISGVVAHESFGNETKESLGN